MLGLHLLPLLPKQCNLNAKQLKGVVAFSSPPSYLNAGSLRY
jgi:hypothetical protein